MGAAVQVAAPHTQGGAWHVPLAMQPKSRAGTDAAGRPCDVWDLAVHPDACAQAAASAAKKACHASRLLTSDLLTSGPLRPRGCAALMTRGTPGPVQSRAGRTRRRRRCWTAAATRL